jgi:hypothetical protein
MSYVLISASVGEHAATHMWNEALTRSYGAHSGVDSPFYRFAKMWAISRTALAFALPKDCVPLAKDAEASKRFERAVGARQIER